MINVYKYWARGGFGLILSGNAMVTPDALTGPGEVVLQKNPLDDPKANALYESLAKPGKRALVNSGYRSVTRAGKCLHRASPRSDQALSGMVGAAGLKFDPGHFYMSGKPYEVHSYPVVRKSRTAITAMEGTMSHTPHELADVFPDQREKLHQLKMSDAHFNKLSDEYHGLNRQIHRYEAGVEATSDVHLEDLKKKRLSLLDQISAMIKSAA